ncbi:hypothetical protein ACROYT_G018003 [Oculina patagonica]
MASPRGPQKSPEMTLRLTKTNRNKYLGNQPVPPSFIQASLAEPSKRCRDLRTPEERVRFLKNVKSHYNFRLVAPERNLMSMADCLQEAPEEWAEFCDSTKKTSLNLTVTDLEDQVIKTLQPGESYQGNTLKQLKVMLKNTKLQLYLEQHPPSEPLRRYTPIPVNQPMPEYVGCCYATCSFSCRTIQEMQAHQTDAKHPGFMMHVMSTPQTECALHAESNSVSGAICTNTRLPWRDRKAPCRLARFLEVVCLFPEETRGHSCRSKRYAPCGAKPIFN